MNSSPINAARILEQLKDFQRCTVDYVFRRLYLDNDATRRFLIADEVGLGKTLVAKGLTSRVIEHLWPSDIERIDIVYICSNADIARQNIARLNVTGMQSDSASTRITLLPIRIRNLNESRINFVSFTPATSFDLKSSMGIAEERALLFWMLRTRWQLKETVLLQVLRGDVSYERFKRRVAEFTKNAIELTLAQNFLNACDGINFEVGDQRLGAEEMCQYVGSLLVRRSHELPGEIRQVRSQFIGRLRQTLAQSCLGQLTPDLIILDEFQRFKTLLSSDTEMGSLAHFLFQYQDMHSSARVILLSATPYKMYTVNGESEDDHYQDFMRTFDFLNQNQDQQEKFKGLLDAYRLALFQLPASLRRVRELKADLEHYLRKVMVRTERLALTENRDGMLQTMAPETLQLEAKDLKSYLIMQKLAREIGEPDTLEYWKSAPYLLNFMDDYTLKARFEDAAKSPESTDKIAHLLRPNRQILLRWSDIEDYKEIDPSNARLRQLIEQTIGKDFWRLLWLPPTLPYYPLGPDFEKARKQNISKQLVFSSWLVVPKVIAVLASYEAERRIVHGSDTYSESYTKLHERSRLLRFDIREDRPVGMPVLGIVYPCLWLVENCDPLSIAEQSPQSYREATEVAKARIQAALQSLPIKARSSSTEDERWYWLAPILLDLAHDRTQTKQWLLHSDLAAVWEGNAPGAEEDVLSRTGWQKHIAELQNVVRLSENGKLRLGRQPKDLSEVLSLIAFGGPGVVLLRALGRVTGRNAARSEGVRDAAARGARAFLRLFNLPEVTISLQAAGGNEPYWRQVLRYGVQGGLQSVMDEYAHLLHEGLGLENKTSVNKADEIIGTMESALAIRSAPMGLDEIRFDVMARTPQLKPPAKRRMRARFSLRFGNEGSVSEETTIRKEQIRDAFNSPFWPFVLATTSVGQEGLDFHYYCHSIVHWNLPSNPVDLEQREGRVHRYKGYAVRKNVAHEFGWRVLNQRSDDPWTTVFRLAEKSRSGDESNIVPYWVYPGEAKIERHVPSLPLSRDIARYETLRRSLTMYRMVFGQNRQEDLMAYLLKLPDGERMRIAQDVQINLSPPCPGSYD